jgi:hypothetical protein
VISNSKRPKSKFWIGVWDLLKKLIWNRSLIKLIELDKILCSVLFTNIGFCTLDTYCRIWSNFAKVSVHFLDQKTWPSFLNSLNLFQRNRTTSASSGTTWPGSTSRITPSRKPSTVTSKAALPVRLSRSGEYIKACEQPV